MYYIAIWRNTLKYNKKCSLCIPNVLWDRAGLGHATQSGLVVDLRRLWVHLNLFF